MDIAIGFLMGCILGIFLGFMLCAYATYSAREQAFEEIKKLKGNTDEQDSTLDQLR